ncbi:MAG: hypothetical protein Q7R76_05605 [Candidatus Woesearchaeota archaeon]|nr:hypothetical protein [Candidatus Woesearchaeota archaeon]
MTDQPLTERLDSETSLTGFFVGAIIVPAALVAIMASAAYTQMKRQDVAYCRGQMSASAASVQPVDPTKIYAPETGSSCADLFRWETRYNSSYFYIK